jgi:hypothetical protein
LKKKAVLDKSIKLKKRSKKEKNKKERLRWKLNNYFKDSK